MSPNKLKTCSTAKKNSHWPSNHPFCNLHLETKQPLPVWLYQTQSQTKNSNSQLRPISDVHIHNGPCKSYLEMQYNGATWLHQIVAQYWDTLITGSQLITLCTFTTSDYSICNVNKLFCSLFKILNKNNNLIPIFLFY